MKPIRFGMLVIAVFAMLMVSCSSRDAGQALQAELIVSAAASLKDAMEEIVTAYGEIDANTKIRLNFGASGTLQRQIEQGAPADLFLSAGAVQMDALAEKQLVIPDTRRDLLSNKLVLIVPYSSSAEIRSFADVIKPEVKKIALGLPETTPAGKYAKESLSALQIWEAVEAKLVMSKDVRQVLAYVASGEVDAGFVYLTDATVTDKVRAAAESDPATHAAIVYPAAVVSGTKHPEEAGRFLEYLQSEQARQVFEAYGFVAERADDL